MSQETIDLTNLQEGEEEEVIVVSDRVTSILLTYPRIQDQLARSGIETNPDGSLSYWEHEQLCQSDSIKAFFLNHLLQLDPQPVHIVVAQELHQDGTPHIHCFVQWLQIRTFPNTYFDFHGMHPNILFCHKPAEAKAYVMKDDTDPLQWVITIQLDDEDEGFFSEVPPPYEE